MSSRPTAASIPAVSVLLTAYNREHYLAESIESVLAQTFEDFELIIVDDGSTDRTPAIIADYARTDPRIRVEPNPSNIGQFANRRRIATLARGRYLKYHDSDDVMYPHCLAAMVKPLEAEPRAGFALSGSRAWPGGPCPMLLTPALAYEREFFGSGLFQMGPAAAMFRTAVFHELGGFSDQGVASDYLFWFHACARVNVLLVPTDLFYYRIHAGQEIVSATAVDDYAHARGTVWKLLKSAECPIDRARLEQARRNFVFTVVRDAYHSVRAGRYGAAGKQLSFLGLTPGEWLRYVRPPRRRSDAGTPVAVA